MADLTVLVRTNALRRLIEAEAPEGLQVMTIHKSKGLEFDNVIVFGIAENSMAHRDNVYDEEVRLQALSLYLDGLSLREISRLLSVNHQSVANWINDYATHMPPNLPPSILEIAILDGFYTPPTRPRRRKISASAPTTAT